MPLTREEAFPLVEMLQDIGYRASFHEDGGSAIESRMSGLGILIFYTPGRSLQFFCGVSLTKLPKFGLVEANNANRKFRFAKFYIDDEGDLALEMDATFNVEREGAREDLEVLVSLFEGSLAVMKEEIASASEGEQAEDPEARENVETVDNS